MQQRDSNNKRRRSATIVAIFIALVLILGIALPIFSMLANAATLSSSSVVQEDEESNQLKPEQEVENDSFTISGTVGFDQTYMVNQVTPFRITVANQGADFSGEVEIKVYRTLGDSYTASQYDLYYQPVELPSGGTQEVDMAMETPVISTFFEVRLVDAAGNLVCRRNLPAKAMNPATVMVGILTDRKEDLGYLTNLTLAKGVDRYDQTSYDAAVFLTKDTLPESTSTLENFALIIVDDFDTSTLSSAQREALRSWVETGGMLVLGGGPNAGKVLSGLGEITDAQLDATTTLTSFENLGALSGETVSGSMFVQRLQVPDGVSLLVEQGNTLLWQTSRGKGSVLLHTFDLALAPAATANNMSAVLSTLYQEADGGAFNVNNRQDYSYNVLGSAATNLSPLSSEKLYVVFVVLAVYVVVAGPVLYLILKKKDRREWGWVIIPALAIAVTVGIYGLSLSSDYRKGIVNVVSLIDLSAGKNTGVAQIYGAAANPNKGELNLDLGEDLNTSPIDNSYNRYSGYKEDTAVPKEELVSRVRTDGNSQMTFYNDQSWETNTFTGTKNIQISGALDLDMTIQGDQFTGTLINHTDLDFSDIVLNVGYEYFLVDNVPAGQTREFSHTIASNLAGIDYYSSYQILQTAFGGSNNYELRQRVRSGEISQERAYQIGQRFNILSDLLNNDVAGLTDVSGEIPVLMYAFNEAPVLENDPVMNGRIAKSSYQNLFVFQGTIDMSQVEDFDIPGGLLRPVSVLGENGGSCYNEGSYIYFETPDTYLITYQFKTNAKLDLFQLETDVNYGTVEQMEVLNQSTGQFETISDQEYTNPYDYFDQDGNLTLRYVVAQEYVEVATPKLRVKGGTAQ